MTVENLYEIINRENDDSEIIALAIVVRDSLSKELTTYHLNDSGGLTRIDEQ